MVKRQEKWEETFKGGSSEDKNLYVALIDKKIGGFINFGKPRDEDRKNQGEIYAVYLLDEFWGMGAGYALFQIAMQKLVENGFSKAYVWVLDTNKYAIDTYIKWGGIVDPTASKFGKIEGKPIGEIVINFTLS